MKKEIKKLVNQISRDVLVYYVLLAGVTFTFAIVRSVMMLSRAGGGETGTVVAELGKSVRAHAGILSIAGTAAGLLFLFFRYRKRGSLKRMWQERKEMKLPAFLRIFCVFMSCQVIFMAAAALAEAALNPLGYTLAEAAQNATAISGTLPLFLYTALVGPVAEEVVFRGFIMDRLLPYGKGFAIVLSAVLFGVMHGNFLQGLFAFGAGLVFGYVAVEYSLKWSVVIHVINNMVFSDLLGRVTKQLPETARSAVEYGIALAFFAAACVILFRKRNEIRGWWQENRPEKRYWVYAFTAVWMILFIIMEICVAMDGVGRL